MVMVEHKTRTLLIGPVEGLLTGVKSRGRHIRDVLYADALGIVRVLSRRCYPLVRRAVTDPGASAAVQMQGCAVGAEHARNHGLSHLGDRVVIDIIRACAHDRVIDRQEKVAVNAGVDHILEEYAHRPVLLCNDDRAEEVNDCRDHGVLGKRTGCAARQGRISAGRGICSFVGLNIASQCGRVAEVTMHLLAVLTQLYHIIVRAGVCDDVRDRNRNVLVGHAGACTVPVSGCWHTETRQRVYEFPKGRGKSPVGGGEIVRQNTRANGKGRCPSWRKIRIAVVGRKICLGKPS